MLDSLIVQQPQGAATSLVLLTHGVGSVPQSMLGVAQWFAERDPQALVVSLASPQPSDISNGLQWFSVQGITETNRLPRVDAAMPGFVATVQHWQRVAGVDAARTLIAGFSQGAIMALESTKLAQPPALRIVAIAGRYATLPDRPTTVAIHLLHGGADPVMPALQAQAAQARLLQLGVAASLDVVPGAQHAPHPAMFERLAERLADTPAR
jgi:phospholipase/carboxylesterase